MARPIMIGMIEGICVIKICLIFCVYNWLSALHEGRMGFGVMIWHDLIRRFEYKLASMSWL
jgi:hypothetical protein